MSTIQPLLQQRYGEHIPSDLLQNSDVLNLNHPVLNTVLQHASLRHFSSQKISPEYLSLLIAAAQSAPTSSNIQAWSVVAVQGEAQKNKLSQLAGNQAFIREAPLFLVWTIDLNRSRDVIQLTEPEQGIEHAIGLESVDSLLIGTIDVALAAQNLTIAARALGLGSVYVGGIRNNLKQVVEVLELPQGVVAVFGVALGYPQGVSNQVIKPRLPQKIVLHHEVYQQQRQLDETSLGEYEKTLNQFQQNVGQPQDRWRDKVTQRLSSLNGREHLAKVFNQQGLNIFTDH
ncbi:nitroreductase family protein [Acinetobacter sp. NIPH 2699]|uniref:nitroreductase family protein n=1 Tax=Acinetobacter sp. NIPH 2699 TaxID=2923433 RepID=UPI001F4AB955|nr:nitroreductase family protein [Acinetobacter sp. NIPH 2699]MCH7336268.1 nitroreductase family protein [Acinetobacter sp. NIPH 2699]